MRIGRGERKRRRWRTPLALVSLALDVLILWAAWQHSVWWFLLFLVLSAPYVVWAIFVLTSER